MPTGYTEILFSKPDTTFPEFALRCARAFGACVEMRDSSLDAPPPDEIKPAAYTLESLHAAEAAVREFEAMTVEEAARRAVAERDATIKSNAECRERFRKESEVLAAMRAEVEAGEPPTPDHAGMRAFMLQQIETSKPHEYQAPETLLTGAEWLTRQRKCAAENVARRAEDWKRDVENAANRTKWLRDLRSSLTKGSAK